MNRYARMFFIVRCFLGTGSSQWEPFLSGAAPMFHLRRFTRLWPSTARRAHTVLVATALSALWWAGAARGGDELPAGFYHDFRGRPTPPQLKPFNAEGG